MTNVSIPNTLSSVDIDTMSETELRQFILLQNQQLQELFTRLTKAQTLLASINAKTIREELLSKRLTKDDNLWEHEKVTVLPSKCKEVKTKKTETPEEKAKRLLGL